MRGVARIAAQLILSENCSHMDAIALAAERYDIHLTDDYWDELEEMINEELFMIENKLGPKDFENDLSTNPNEN